MVLFKEDLRKLLLLVILVQIQLGVGYAQCNDPTGLDFSNITNEGAALQWDLNPIANEYRLAYRIKSTNKWVAVISTSNTNYSLNGLLSGTTYQWGVRSICPSENSNFIFGPEFTTTGPAACGLPVNLTSTVLSQNSVSLNWDPANGETSFRVIYWRRDALGSDTDTSPNAQVTTTNTNTTTLYGLQSGTTYHWTVRTVCDGIPMQSDLSIFGSFQTMGSIRCEDPANLQVSYSQSGVPSFSCDIMTGGTAYRFAYHELGSTSEWVEIVTDSIPAFSPNLTPGVTYEWGIRTICENDSTVSAFIYGTDYQAGDRCQVPRNLRSFVRSSGTILRWSRRAEASTYDLQIRVQGSQSWFTSNIPWWAVWLSGTTPGVTYEWRVRSVCNTEGSFVSEYSNIEIFTTPANPAAAPEDITYQHNPKSDFSAALTTAGTLQIADLSSFPDLGLYSFGPNPATNQINVDPFITEGLRQVNLVNMKGEYMKIPISYEAGGWKLNVESLSRGLYLLLITTDEGVFKERVLLM